MQTQQQTVEDYMSKSVKTLSPTDGLVDALLITCSSDVRHIPVLVDGKLVGVVSDRDVKRALPTKQYHDGKDVWDLLEKIRLEEIMTRNVLTIEPIATLRDAASVMMREKISALPVVHEEKLIGIITTEDILWAYITEE